MSGPVVFGKKRVRDVHAFVNGDDDGDHLTHIITLHQGFTRSDKSAMAHVVTHRMHAASMKCSGSATWIRRKEKIDRS